MKDSLVIQSYGSEHEYKRAVLSIWSFYVWPGADHFQTILFTDNPDYFRQLCQGLPIKYILLTPDKIKKMRGAINFVHRVKIAVIEEAFQHTSGNLLYTDSDTFFISDPADYIHRLSSATAFMHLNEYQFRSLKLVRLPAGKTFHIFYDFVMNRPFTLTDGSSITILPDQISWNAGVIILHHEHKKLLHDVFKLTEDFYPSTQNHGCEQYAFSIVLGRNTQVHDCKNLVYHYWPVVKKAIADKFIAKRITPGWAASDAKNKSRDIKIWIDELPKVFENDILMLRDRSIQYFNENYFTNGARYALKAFSKQPFNFKFLKDVLYHLNRGFKRKFSK